MRNQHAIPTGFCSFFLAFFYQYAAPTELKKPPYVNAYALPGLCAREGGSPPVPREYALHCYSHLTPPAYVCEHALIVPFGTTCW